MTGRVAVLIRHGAYHQLENTPSALQPFPLTAKGKVQAKACGQEVADWLAAQSFSLNPVVYCSPQLRAWQTARIACDVLEEGGYAVEISETPALSERSVGSAANLTLADIERVLTEDPRHDTPPAGWKSDSDYLLPLHGAESLMMAGRRVAAHLESVVNDQGDGSATLFFGHGASFRHAAHVLGILSRQDIARLSMHHAKPLQICRNPDGTWSQCGGSWKIRGAAETALD